MMNTQEKNIIQTALEILTKYQKSTDIMINKNCLAVNFLQLQFESCEREVFSVMFLNNRNQLIAFENIFYGTINQTEVHPREIVRRAMSHNAVGVILAHNHPSGYAEPSEPDISITVRLQKALALVGVEVLDHIIIGSGSNECVSFAERRLLAPSFA